MRYSAKYTPTAEDEITCHQMEKGETASVRPYYVIAGAVLAGLTVYVGHFVNAPVLMVKGALLGIAAAAFPFWAEWRIRRNWKEGEIAFLAFTFDESGLEVGNQQGNLKFGWHQVSKARLDSRGVWMRIPALGAVFVPARAFGPEGYPQSNLKELLWKKIQKNA